MNKRIKNKKEKMRLALLRATELGGEFTEMDDVETVLSFIKAHKNDIPENKLNVNINDEKIILDPTFDEETSLTEEEFRYKQAHEAAIADRERYEAQLALEKEKQRKYEETQTNPFMDFEGCPDDDEISYKREAEENHIEESRMKEEKFDNELAKHVKDEELSKQSIPDSEINQPNLDINKSGEYNSEALAERLVEEENRIKLEAEIKDEQKKAELESEKVRSLLLNKNIDQALFELSNSSNKESSIEKENLKDHSVKPVSKRKKIKILKSSKDGKEVLLVKRSVAEAAGLDEGENSLKNPKSLNKSEGIECKRKGSVSKNTDSLDEGISIVNEAGIEYVIVNGIKIDTKEKIVKALGIDENKLEQVNTQEIIKDDNINEMPIEDTETSIRKEMKKKNGKKKRKKIVIWLVVLAFIIGGTYIYNFYNSNRRLPWAEEKLTGEAAITYMDVKVEELITSPKVKITGSLEALDLQTVVLRTNGAIKSIDVKEGDIVKKGDVLVTVDDTTEQYNIANLESQLKSAKLMGNANNVRLLELQLDNAKNNLEYTKAKANFDGVVAEQGWTVGDYNSLTVKNSNNMIIADLSKFKATVAIDELDIGYVRVGEVAELSFDSLPGTIVDAYVSNIPMLGYYSKQGFGVLNVEITIPNPPKQLKTGFTFSGTIISDNEESITIVDQAAITSKGDKTIVRMKMADGTIKEIPVNIRYLGENKCQILSGDVYVGDTVVIENALSFAEENGINLGL